MSDDATHDELRRVRSEVDERCLPSFTHSDAIELGASALRLADDDDLPVVIQVRRGRQLSFHAARAGTTAEHDDWIRRKINTALTHEVPSYEFLLRQRASGRVPDWLDPREFAVAGGAVPIRVGDAVVGVIAVSGIVTSPSGDHDLAMMALRATGEAPA